MLRLGNVNDIQRLNEVFWNKDESFYTWGNEDLDRELPIIGVSQLVILAGAQGSGKTTWSLQMALENARRGKAGGYSVGYLSLEVAPENVLRRMAERKIGVTKESRRKGLLFDDDLIAKHRVIVNETYKEFIDSGLLFFPSDDTDDIRSIETIRKVCEDEYGPSLLFIDNLAEILCDKDDEYNKMDYIMRELSDLRMNTNTTIVLLHHLAKSKDGEPVTINSIKGNNIVVTKADVTVVLDKHKAPNFNWECHWKHKGHDGEEGEVVERVVMNKFKAYAPQLTVRSIHSFKDRYYGVEGLMGYMRLDEEGKVEFLNDKQMKELFPLFPTQQKKLEATYERYKLLPPKTGEEEETPDILTNIFQDADSV